MLSKPLQTITASDVAAFVDSHPPETDALELKQQLPAKGADVDPWERGEDRIGDRARNEILEEVVAFANAHGGHVLLGVEESDDHPKRATGVRPIRACEELATRLSQQAGACIDPQLPVLEIRGIPTQADGGGIVVIRVPQSAAAPHQVKPVRSCTVRRADRCEQMTMREVQDLTLQRAASGAGLDAEFTHRRELFVEALATAKKSAGGYLYVGVRVTALPTVRLDVPRAALGEQLKPYLQTFALGSGETVHAQAYLPFSSYGSRPIVRGRRWEIDRGSGGAFTIEIHQSGMVEYTLIDATGERHPCLHPAWIVGTFANVLATANVLRHAAAAPGAEYAVDLEIRREHGQLLTMALFGSGFASQALTLTPNPLLLPRYSFGSVDELASIVGLVTSDLFAAGGISCDPSTYQLIGPKETLDRIGRGEL